MGEFQFRNYKFSFSAQKLGPPEENSTGFICFQPFHLCKGGDPQGGFVCIHAYSSYSHNSRPLESDREGESYGCDENVKQGKVKGFSIAGDFINKAQPVEGTDEDTLGKIVNILKEIR